MTIPLKKLYSKRIDNPEKTFHSIIFIYITCVNERWVKVFITFIFRAVSVVILIVAK